MSSSPLQGDRQAADLKIGLVAARFNPTITDRLLDGAQTALSEQGCPPASVTITSVPGALELPLVAQTMAESGRYDAIVCLGCVIRGETSHYDCVAMGSQQGIMQASLNSRLPILFGVLTCENREQALARSDSQAKVNVGHSTTLTAIEIANLLKKLPQS